MLQGVGALVGDGLRVPTCVMAARYPGEDLPGAPGTTPYRGYKLHTDNEILPDGEAANERYVTAILYANDNAWDADELGGQLHLYPGSRDKPDDDDLGVVVEPKGGRVVLFDSFLWHQVRPAKHPRYAITNWITRHREPRAQADDAKE